MKQALKLGSWFSLWFFFSGQQNFEVSDLAPKTQQVEVPLEWIIGAGVLKGFELSTSANEILFYDVLTITGLSFLFALVAISLLMVWLRRANFTPFVIYRVLLGGVLLSIVYVGHDWGF